MKVFSTIQETKKYLRQQFQLGKSIGFVPTMGALHAGHINLVERSKRENDLTIASIFVNPTQFNNPEDLKKYPRTLETDCALLSPAGCDVVFAPSAEEMYGSLPNLSFHFGSLETVMEGAFRPGHFNGVGIVVSKLFHIIQPQRAYFGLKDLQQVAVIRRLVYDLSFDLEIIPCETVRESDGLAMSSRNMRLTFAERQLAPQVFQTLQIAKNSLLEGESTFLAKEKAMNYLKKFPEFSIEYIEISDFDALQPIESINKNGKTAVCIAAFLGSVRLIDNVVF
jgi:pantoate--beta-alanine ligase